METLKATPAMSKKIKRYLEVQKKIEILMEEQSKLGIAIKKKYGNELIDFHNKHCILAVAEVTRTYINIKKAKEFLSPSKLKMCLETCKFKKLTFLKKK